MWWMQLIQFGPWEIGGRGKDAVFLKTANQRMHENVGIQAST